jgi:hypothetical protein
VTRFLENNLSTQIGPVKLIGLAAKNAILITVEFARAESVKGVLWRMPRSQAPDCIGTDAHHGMCKSGWSSIASTPIGFEYVAIATLEEPRAEP